MFVVPPLNVTVKAPPEPNTAEQGLVVPEQVDELRPAVADQPAKVDPGAAVALNVTTAPLSEVLMLGEHVLVTVCEAAGLPVPPQETGAWTVPVLTVIFTEPLPVPAKVRSQLRESVNVICARERESDAIR